MKTRIISGVIGALIFIAIILISTDILLPTGFPIILTLVLSLLSAMGVYELLHNTGIVKNNIIMGISCAFSFLLVIAFSIYGAMAGITLYFAFVAVLLTVSLTVHSKTSYAELVASQAYTLFVAYAFYCLDNIVRNYGKFAFLLVFIFAWLTDTFAYFTGVFFGKHKLCPVLSPKKTIEGAVGGVVGCVICTVVACVIRIKLGGDVNIIAFIPATIIFSILGMVGDISASYIKRAVGIKDYGNIMPGHGGVIDRFDSVLLIAPVYHALLYWLPLINS
ncbi:MAG: phosphatidate cytidylyltransferase [Clostridia bacterium]|nr:phosphatidate cytidylyltransferase [Clostridia bacterium]